VEKGSQNLLFSKMPLVNGRPVSENSPNLAILDSIFNVRVQIGRNFVILEIIIQAYKKH
jgi:hypothetical protein